MTSQPGSLIRPVMPELDTLRGIAVLGVVFLHGFEWQYGMLRFSPPASVFLTVTQRGSLGVDLFFILSGFLITGILIDSRDLPRFYARFYTRRALRILPVYYALLLLLLILHSSSVQFVALSFIYLANMTGMFGVPGDYGPLWSLAVEEHFYLLWPTIVHRLRKERLAIVCLCIVALVPLLRLACFQFNWGKGSLGLYTWFVADGLATGSLVAVLLRVFESRNCTKAMRLVLIVLDRVSNSGRTFWNNHPGATIGRRPATDNNQSVFCGLADIFLVGWDEPPQTSRKQFHIPVFWLPQLWSLSGSHACISGL
jgi:peptidoglycan/LPS O-acetylase OafA/YrhL